MTGLSFETKAQVKTFLLLAAVSRLSLFVSESASGSLLKHLPNIF